MATSGVGRKVLRHPEVGKLVFEQALFRPQETPEQRLVLPGATLSCRGNELRPAMTA